MDKNNKVICEFFNIKESDLKNEEDSLIDKMARAINKDDFEKLHFLGYELKTK